MGVGLKSQFLREGGTAETFTRIANVASISPPQPSRNMVDKEDLDPPDGIQQRVPGLIDAGELSVTLNFDADETGHDDLESDFWAGVSKNYQILYPNGSGLTIPAIVSGWAPQEIGAEDIIQVEVTLTVTGKPTPVTGESTGV